GFRGACPRSTSRDIADTAGRPVPDCAWGACRPGASGYTSPLPRENGSSFVFLSTPLLRRSRGVQIGHPATDAACQPSHLDRLPPTRYRPISDPASDATHNRVAPRPPNLVPRPVGGIIALLRKWQGAQKRRDGGSKRCELLTGVGSVTC